MMLLSFELEIAIDSDIKGVEESVTNIRDFQVLEKSLTAMGQPFPIHQEDFFQDEGRLDIQSSALYSTWHQCLLDHDPNHLISAHPVRDSFGKAKTCIQLLFEN